MRYIIAETKVSDKELSERMKYIYEVFHVYTFKDNLNSTKDITILNTIPPYEHDILLIVGHDCRTDKYLIENHRNISEKIVVIISCNTGYFKCLSLLHKHIVYFPKNKKIVSKYNGKIYGFEFDLTKEEILLYRKRKKEIYRNLEDIFERRTKWKK